MDVSSRKMEDEWTWSLHLNGYGYGHDLYAVTETEKIIIKGNRIEYHRGDMVEWYINDHRGFEQGFTLKTRPSGWPGSELLQIKMTTSWGRYEDDNSTGSVYIFSRDQGGADTWGQFQKLTAGDGETYDYFGYFGVSISGDMIIVGAHRNDDSGSVNIYRYQQGAQAHPWVPLLLLNN